MSEDPVLREVRRIKETIAAKHRDDVGAIAKEAREICRLKGFKTVSRPPKRVTRP